MATRRMKKAGNWASAKRKVEGLLNACQSSSIEAMQAISEKAVRTVKQHIIMQDLNWRELRKSTIERKGHSDAWRNTGLMMDSIVAEVSAGSTTYERGGAKKTGIARKVEHYTAKVGVKEGVHYPDGRSLASVAKLLEEGGRTEKSYIHKRPLFAPSAKEVEQWNMIYNNPARITVKALSAI